MTTFVYVHSADRVFGGTPSNFQIQLPQPLAFTGKTRVRVDSVRIPNTYKTIDEGNRYLYLKTNAGGDQFRTLPVGNYNATQIGTLFATYIDGSSTGSVYDATNNTLQLNYQPAGTFSHIHFYTDAEIAAGTYKGAYPTGCGPSKPNSCNNILQNDSTGKSEYLNSHSSYRIKFFSTLPHDYVFLRSKLLSSRHSVSVQGDHDVLAMIPVNSAFAEILTGETPINHSLEIHAIYLNSFDIRLTDRFDNPVTQTADISFQLTFIT